MKRIIAFILAIVFVLSLQAQNEYRIGDEHSKCI